MPKPTIVFVPGAWLTPEIYARTMSILDAAGYPTVGLALPSAGAVPAHPNFDGDAKGVRDCLTRLAVDEEKEVVLIVHSYTGMPASEALVEMGKKEREEKRMKGGVVRLVFINALVVPEGFCLTDGGAEFLGWMGVDAEVWLPDAVSIRASR
jgi:pimeloyl-ACP methyl ester carboxylesterase